MKESERIFFFFNKKRKKKQVSCLMIMIERLCVREKRVSCHVVNVCLQFSSSLTLEVKIMIYDKISFIFCQMYKVDLTSFHLFLFLFLFYFFWKTENKKRKRKGKRRVGKIFVIEYMIFLMKMKMIGDFFIYSLLKRENVRERSNRLWKGGFFFVGLDFGKGICICIIYMYYITFDGFFGIHYVWKKKKKKKKNFKKKKFYFFILNIFF